MSSLLCAAARVVRPRVSHAVAQSIVAAPAAAACTAVRALSYARARRADATTAAAAPAAAAASASSSSSSSSASVDPSPEVGLTGGAPEEFVRRTCRVYRPSRSASQQGPEYRWKIEFDTPNKWVNPLMGWTSARDTAQQLREVLYFPTEADAVGFAQREGFHYTVLPYHAKVIKPKAFADNFKWKGAPKVEQQK